MEGKRVTWHYTKVKEIALVNSLIITVAKAPRHHDI